MVVQVKSAVPHIQQEQIASLDESQDYFYNFVIRTVYFSVSQRPEGREIIFLTILYQLQSTTF
jgi:hypothetical protein